MPTYTFERQDGSRVSAKLTYADYDKLMSGESVMTDETTGEALKLVFDPGQIGFVLKDGESGGWASKAMVERKQRAARRVVLEQKENDHVFKPKLVPNFNGQVADKWADVRDHVRSTAGVGSAKTYDKLVQKEQKSP